MQGREGSRGPREPHRPPPSLTAGRPSPCPGPRAVRGVPRRGARRGAWVAYPGRWPHGVALSRSGSAAPTHADPCGAPTRCPPSPLTSWGARWLAAPRAAGCAGRAGRGAASAAPSALRAGPAARARSGPSRGRRALAGTLASGGRLGSRGDSAARPGCSARVSSPSLRSPRAPLASRLGTVSGAGRPHCFIRRGSRFDPPTSARRNPTGWLPPRAGGGAGPCRCHGPAAPAGTALRAPSGRKEGPDPPQLAFTERACCERVGPR